MKRKRNLTVYFAVMTAVILLAACSTPPGSTTEPESDNNAGLANPAAVYCEGLGYTLETVERNGGQDANCVFPDGSTCPQWDFLAGRCGQPFSYCEQQSGVLEEGEGNIGVCHFLDGSFCDEVAFFSGECAVGEASGYPVGN